MTALILRLDGMTVPVETAGASRKARLTVEADGSLRIRAGEDVQPSELERFLASKRAWVYRRLAEKEVLRHEPVTKELVDGEGFLYLGRNYRLLLSDGVPCVRLHHGRLTVPRSAVAAGDGGRLIAAWYQERGSQWLAPRIKECAGRLRVSPSSLEVADLGHKWGAASVEGRIRIHWATLQLSPQLVDYVLAHELTHLREAHHGPAFWQLLARVMPDYSERKRELAERGARLWFGGTL